MKEIFERLTGRKEKYPYPGYTVRHGIEGGTLPKVTDPVIMRLIDQAEGIDREQEPPTGFLAKFKRKEEIDLNTQLQAIHKLGHSASQEALDFLTWLYTPIEGSTSVVTHQSGNWLSTQEGIEYREIHYPNAIGALSEALRLQVVSGDFHILGGKTIPTSKTDRKLKSQKSSNPAHLTINYAIERLRTDLQLITQPDTPSYSH